jgi:ParB family chromosome partitioning protein
MMDCWKPDDAFFDLLRDKEAINAMLKHVGGKSIADGNISSTAKIQKQIIQDCINGENGRKAKENWEPRYMKFPMAQYTKREGIAAIDQYKAIKKHYVA